MSSEDATLSRLSAAFRRDPKAFLREPLQIRWWVHGGEPGSPSDAMTIVGANGAFSATYHRIRFDFALVPPKGVEDTVRAVTVEAVERLLEDMFASLFGTRFAEEDGHAMADAREEQWELQRGPDTLAKTFYEPFPLGLAALRERFADCIRGR